MRIERTTGDISPLDVERRAVDRVRLAAASFEPDFSFQGYRDGNIGAAAVAAVVIVVVIIIIIIINIIIIIVCRIKDYPFVEVDDVKVVIMDGRGKVDNQGWVCAVVWMEGG